MSQKGVVAFAGLAVFGAVVALLAAPDALAKYEEPVYTLVAREGNIEVRQYPSVIAAEVTVAESGSQGANSAFKILAGYIFGKNRGSKKIAMTVPVTQQATSEKIAMTVPVTTQKSGDGMQMRFFMPKQYTLATLPEPEDKRIKFTELPPAKFAVIRFSGFAHEDSISRHTSELLTYLKQHNLESDGAAVRAFYNPPWTLPFLRRNEVWIPLKS